ncbi:serine/threonine protein kinase [Halostreptopolyspora alba]|uniref:non-specific serine/threonine protein kinase n=2 Tax=Halostreptopolyspora alba TaxID=2487137 RepID=A0A3N0E964_9ACTN|nr:serine/threonine protein kinase [Nocardiopsaceae bacterium YIM 96095]
MSGGERSTATVHGFHSFALAYRGRHSWVYRAVSERSGATVALKVMEETQGRQEIGWLRGLAGVRGVVPLLDIARASSGAPVAVMPFYPEGSYVDILNTQGALRQVYEAVRVGRAVAGALAVLHRQGVLHNEVVPSNVLRAGGTAALTDFGSAAEIGAPPVRLRTSSDLVTHAPPEILRGTPPDPASDIYQLASTLWTLLAGRPPFYDEDGSSVDPQTYAERSVGNPAPPVPRTDVPRELNEVLLRALAKDPADRYETPGTFEVALERAGTGHWAPADTGGGSAPGAALRSPAGTGSDTPPVSDQPDTEPRPQRPEPRHRDPNTSATNLRGGIRRRGSEPRPPAESPPPPTPGPAGTEPAEPPPSEPPPRRAPEPNTAGTGEWRSPTVVGPHGAEPGRAEPGSPEPSGFYTSSLENLRGNGKDTIGLTADLVARLRGVTLSRDHFAQRGWVRLEGWTGRANSVSLPVPEDRDETETEGWPDYGDLRPGKEPHWRRHLHIAAAVASIVLIAGATSVIAALRPGPGMDGAAPASVAAAAGQDEGQDAAGGGADDEEDAAGGAESGGEQEPSPEPDREERPDVAEPDEVVLEDSLSSVQVRWNDNSGGTATYFVVGGIADHDPETLARTGPGAEVARVTTEDTVAEYCFTVVAVDGVSAASPETCTERAAARAEQQREEEEEQEEEEAGQESGDEDTSQDAGDDPGDGEDENSG